MYRIVSEVCVMQFLYCNWYPILVTFNRLSFPLVSASLKSTFFFSCLIDHTASRRNICLPNTCFLCMIFTALSASKLVLKATLASGVGTPLSFSLLSMPFWRTAKSAKKRLKSSIVALYGTLDAWTTHLESAKGSLLRFGEILPEPLPPLPWNRPEKPPPLPWNPDPLEDPWPPPWVGTLRGRPTIFLMTEKGTSFTTILKFPINWPSIRTAVCCWSRVANSTKASPAFSPFPFNMIWMAKGTAPASLK